MSILGGSDDLSYDEAEELVADLRKLCSCGLITAVRELGGPTRYAVVPPDDDRDVRERDVAPDAILSAG